MPTPFLPATALVTLPFRSFCAISPLVTKTSPQEQGRAGGQLVPKEKPLPQKSGACSS